MINRNKRQLYQWLLVVCLILATGWYLINSKSEYMHVRPTKKPPMTLPKELEKESKTVRVAEVDISNLEVATKWKIKTDDAIAKELEKISVLCWIAVTKSSMEKARLVQKTWGTRCTKFLLMGDETTEGEKDVISLKVPKGRKSLWDKTREAFQYIVDNHINDADWFLKADTDSYVIMENLRYMLSTKNAAQPHFLGCNILLYIPKGYNSGGAGYLLNKVAVEYLVYEAYKDKKCYNGYTSDEDVSLGYCMSKINIMPGDTTDEKHKNRFFPFEPYDHIGDSPIGANIWYWKSTYKPGEKSFDCCSETVIAFHYVPVNVFYAMEFLLYHTKLFGITNTFEEIKPPNGTKPT